MWPVESERCDWLVKAQLLLAVTQQLGWPACESDQEASWLVQLMAQPLQVEKKKQSDEQGWGWRFCTPRGPGKVRDRNGALEVLNVSSAERGSPDTLQSRQITDASYRIIDKEAACPAVRASFPGPWTTNREHTPVHNPGSKLGLLLGDPS
jgi:hypothetical protein